MSMIDRLSDILWGIVLVCAIVAAAILISPNADISRGIGHGIIHEDDVKWNCETMGNLKCGPQLIELDSPQRFWKA